MIGFILYMAGILVFIVGVLTPLLLDSKTGREAKRKGAIR